MLLYKIHDTREREREREREMEENHVMAIYKIFLDENKGKIILVMLVESVITLQCLGIIILFNFKDRLKTKIKGKILLLLSCL